TLIIRLGLSVLIYRELIGANNTQLPSLGRNPVSIDVPDGGLASEALLSTCIHKVPNIIR
ncbi:hypothetical protein LINPERPRIM_LOCUS36465, partial [Linum perenne]